MHLGWLSLLVEEQVSSLMVLDRFQGSTAALNLVGVALHRFPKKDGYDY